MANHYYSFHLSLTAGCNGPLNLLHKLAGLPLKEVLRDISDCVNLEESLGMGSESKIRKIYIVWLV